MASTYAFAAPAFSVHAPASSSVAVSSPVDAGLDADASDATSAVAATGAADVVGAADASAPIPAAALPPGSLVISCAGAASNPALSSNLLAAVREGARLLAGAVDPLDVATRAVVLLEDDPNLNAGTGSAIRIDGVSVQMDALAMDAQGRFGAVAAIGWVRNPVLVARTVADTPYSLLVGSGAVGFARSRGYPVYDPGAEAARARRDRAIARMLRGLDAGVAPTGAASAGVTPAVGDGAAPVQDASLGDNSDKDELGYELFPPRDSAEGVVVVVRSSQGGFAVAASDGGRAASLSGQVGAIPVLGAAVFVGPDGAVAATGPAALLVRQSLARRIYDRMTRSGSPKGAAVWGLAQLPAQVDGGVIAVDRHTYHVGSRGPMAWALWTPEGERVAAVVEEVKR
jgi:isoaspartyl peptidase/L-asparaginase-like protein (Ntn-hydrolase superfamily)